MTGRKIRFVLIVAVLMQTWSSHSCEAQMFGARTVGRPLGQPSAGSMSSDAGTLQGAERFLRGNRSADDFVGVDARDRARFVGLINARNQMAIGDTAVSNAPRADQAAQVNSPIKSRAANSMREPLLQIGFEIAPESTERLAEKAQTRIGQAITARFGNQIEVSVAIRTAILRGEVDDAADVRLAELMVSLEPGISKVQNELTPRAAKSPQVEQNLAPQAGQVP